MEKKTKTNRPPNYWTFSFYSIWFFTSFTLRNLLQEPYSLKYKWRWPKIEKICDFALSLSLSLSLLVYINIYFVVFIFRLERSLKEEETKIKIKHRKKKRNTQRRRRCGQDKRIGALGAWIFGFQFLILIICILSSELPHRPCWLLSLRACSIVDFFSISFVSFFTFGCVLYDQLYIWNEIPSADIWLFLFSPQVLEFVFFF